MTILSKPNSKKSIIEFANKIRLIESEILNMYSKNLINGTIHLCTGQEMISGVFASLVQDDDFVFSNHRNHGHFLATTLNLDGLILELLGNSQGTSMGIGGSQHLHSNNFISHGVQGGLLPSAAGIAYTKKNSSSAVISFIGDGTLGQGLFYEVLNISSLFKLPHLFIVEDNMYAQSTKTASTSVGTLKAKAKAFDIQYIETNIWDFDHLLLSFQSAISDSRNNTPTILHIHCYRLAPHSKGDDFRDIIEIEKYQKIDPLKSLVLNSSDTSLIQDRVRELVKMVDEHEYDSSKVKIDHTTLINSFLSNSNYTIAKQLNSSLTSILATNKLTLCIGEDIRDPYGGAFKITKGLSTKFNDQVINFPISEASLVGFSNGISFVNNVVCEIMFSDFLPLTFDQIFNHISKFQFLGKVKNRTSLIIRCANGGYQGYGPTHGQSLEKYFTSIPGIISIVPHHRCNLSNIFCDLFSTYNFPIILFEHKNLYNFSLKALPEKWEHIIDRGLVSHIRDTRFKTKDLTIVSFGFLASVVEEIAITLGEEEDIYIDLFVPINISNIPLDSIIASLSSTKKLIIIEESTQGQTISSEIVANLKATMDFQYLPICSKLTIIPSSKQLESKVLPSKDYIKRCIEEFFYD